LHTINYKQYRNYGLNLVFIFLFLFISLEVIAESKKLPAELKRMILQEQYHEVLPKLRKLASQQHQEAAYQLATLYLVGQGIPKDKNKAIYWFRQASKAGHIKASYKLGLIYQKSATKNTKARQAAIHYFELAASHDHKMAKHQLNTLKSGTNNTGELSQQQLNMNLIQAAKHGKIVQVRQLLKTGAAINAQEPSGQNALTAALLNNKISVTKELLRAGIDKNARNQRGESALHIAITSKNAQAIQVLLENNARVNILDNSGNSPLHYAVLSNETKLAKILLKHGADANLNNDFNQTAFTMAKSKGQQQMLKLLTQYGAHSPEEQTESNIKRKLAGYEAIRLAENSQQKTWSDLMMSAWYGDTEVSAYLLDQGVGIAAKNPDGNSALTLALLKENEPAAQKVISRMLKLKSLANTRALQNALDLAAEQGLESVIQQLLKAGVKPDYSVAINKTSLAKAIKNGHEDTAIHFLQNDLVSSKDTVRLNKLLVLAAQKNMPSLVKQCLKLKVPATSKDEHGKTALWHAVDNNNVHMVTILIRAGGDANQMDHDQQSPFIRAVLTENKTITKLMLKEGGDVHSQTSSGNTPLMLATSTGNQSLTTLLIENGSDIEHRNKFSLTPLMIAVKNGHNNIVRILIDKGASPYRKSQEGKNAFDYAKGNNEIINLLK